MITAWEFAILTSRRLTCSTVADEFGETDFIHLGSRMHSSHSLTLRVATELIILL